MTDGHQRRAPRAGPARGVRPAGGPAGPPLRRLRPRRGGGPAGGRRGADGLAPGRSAATTPRPGCRPPPTATPSTPYAGPGVSATSPRGPPARTSLRPTQTGTDDRLALLFACCHPALAPEARLALTLRAVVGLTTPQIARAFLANETTLAQRIVRAKRKIVTAGISLAVPEPGQLTERLADVLAVVYVMFNEGFVSSTGPTQDRDLAADAVWLAEVVATSLPEGGRRVGAGGPAVLPARPGGRALRQGRRPGPARRPGPLPLGRRPHRHRARLPRPGGALRLRRAR